MNCRSKKMLNAPPPNQAGSVRGMNVSMASRRDQPMKVGTRVTALGSIMVERIAMNAMLRPGQRRRLSCKRRANY